MATYKHIRSNVDSKRPTTSLADGQIAINTNVASPGVFFKDSAGTGIVKVGPVHVGTSAPNSTPGVGGSTGNSKGEQWLDTSLTPAQLKVWNGSAWVGVVADELPVSKLQNGSAYQLLQTDAAGTGVEWASNIDVPGSLNVTSTAVFDSTASHPLGSAAAPTITFTGDANTGIYSPGIDQVAISTNGTGRLFIDASGNVGVGTAAPDRVFEIKNAAPIIRLTDTDNNYSEISANTSILSLRADEGNGASSSWIDFRIDGSERLRIDSSGNVGIGTSSPDTKLDVNGNVQFGDGGGFDMNINGTRHQFSIGGSEKMRIDSSGKVGIGTTSPSNLLDVASAVGDGIRIGASTAGTITRESEGLRITGVSTNKNISFVTAGSEACRIDTSGRLLVGTSSARDKFGYDKTPRFQVEGTNREDSSISITRWNSGQTAAPVLFFGGTNSGTPNVYTLVNDGEYLGEISFEGADGSKFVAGANIKAAVDGTPGADDMPGRLVFSTTADGASSPTERLRIDSSGNVGINASSPGRTLDVDGVIRADGTSGSFELGDNSSTPSVGCAIHRPANNTMAFVTGTNERLRIDSSGRLLVGTSSSPSAGNGQYAKLVVQGFVGGTGAAFASLQRAEAATSITTDELIGVLSFDDSSGNTFAEIAGRADGTAGTSDYPGRLVLLHYCRWCEFSDRANANRQLGKSWDWRNKYRCAI